MTAPAYPDPMEFLKSLWGNLQTPLPGLLPTVDAGELERRIADLKAVEAWLQTNAQMVRMTIQGLEVQRATLAVLNAAATQGAEPKAAPASAAMEAATWPLQFMQSAAEMFGTAADAAVPASRGKRSPKPRRKSAGG